MEYSPKICSTQIESQAQQALEDFLTPPRNQPSESEQALLAQATLFSVPFGSIEINAFSWGTGATILLVHGWGGYGLQMSGFVEPLLQAGYRVLAFDAPAHGGTMGIQTNGLELARAISTVSEHQAPIAGVIAHSFGANSTTLALSEGMQVCKAIYLGAACSLLNTTKVFARRAKLSIEVQAALKDLFESRFGRDIWQRLAIDRNIRNFSIPALLFHDRKDREVSIEESRTIAKVWSGAQLVETSGLGHRRILHNQQVVQQAVDFLMA
jgi:pimeloyl-ACP methyl ester carboxylesterase